MAYTAQPPVEEPVPLDFSVTVRAHEGHPIHADPDRLEQRIAEAVAGALRAEVTVEWDVPF